MNNAKMMAEDENPENRYGIEDESVEIVVRDKNRDCKRRGKSQKFACNKQV